MLLFFVRRLSLFLFTMLLLTWFAFSLAHLFPGDPLINLTGQVNANPEQLIALGQQYRTEDHMIFQYFSYLEHIISGDLGLSMASQLPIANELANLLPATIELSIVALAIAMMTGVPIGFVAAIYHKRKIDDVILTFSMIGYSIPIFWLGLLAVLIFSIELGWLPSAGQLSLIYEIDHVTGFLIIDILLSDNTYKWQAFADATAHIILPACVVALAPATIFIRLARTTMLEILETSYIKAAKAKGLSFRQIIYRHAVRNAMIQVVRHVGLQFASLMTLAMVTEVIFSWPGIGRWLIDSIYQRDYTAIQNGLLVLSIFIFIVHIITDLTYAGLNPLARERSYGS